MLEQVGLFSEQQFHLLTALSGRTEMACTAVLCPYLRGWELGGDVPIDGSGEELFPQDVLELLGQDLLLLHTAVVLQRQDHGVLRGLRSNMHTWRSALVGLLSSPKGFIQA